MFWTLYPESSLATYGEGDYTLKLDGYEKNLSKASCNINLKARQKNLYFNSSSDLQIDLQDKKPEISNARLSVYNRLYNLSLFNSNAEISQLVEPSLNLFGVKLEHTKKTGPKTNKAMFFIGKSNTSQVVGSKITVEYAPNTSYSLFLLNKENTQIMGISLSKPIHKFSLLQGECYLDNQMKYGLLLKNSINYKKNTLQTEYSIINRVSGFKLFDRYQTKKSNTEIEYSTTNQNNLWRLKGNFKNKGFNAGGAISKRKGKAEISSFSSDTFSYNGYAGYNWKVLERIIPSITYSHSYSNTSGLYGKNILDSICVRGDYSDFKTKLSISTKLEVGMEKQRSQNSIKKELTFRRGIKIGYAYYGFKPWIDYDLSASDDKVQSVSPIESTSLSYGISKNVTRHLSLSYTCYHGENSGSRGEGTERRQRFITMDYRFPKLPITLMTKVSWINKDKPASFVSIAYKKGKEKDTLIKYQNEEIEYTRERPVKFGTTSLDMVAITKEFPQQNELSRLGKIKIMVFKDEDADGKFTEKDIPIKGVKMKLIKAEIITNEDGEACFIDIPSGTYTFAMDANVIPVGFACPTNLEQIFKIEGGQDIYLDFPVIRSGKISGAVFIDKNRNGKWDENEKGAEDILILANAVPKYTSFNGKYRFTNIIPGIIKVKVDVKSLPENFEMTTKDSFEVKLLPNEEIRDINFGVAEIEPEIEFEE